MEVTQEQLKKAHKDRKAAAKLSLQRLIRLVDECNPEVVGWHHITSMGVILETASRLVELTGE